MAEINRDAVKNLKAEWRIHLNSGTGPQHSGQAQPLFYDGVLYSISGANDVFAIDVETGNSLWKYEAGLDPARVKVCCGWVSRGVGLGDGKVCVGQLDARLIALDQRTGKVVWSIQAEDPTVGYSITGAPLYYDGMVITGFAGGKGTTFTPHPSSPSKRRPASIAGTSSRFITTSGTTTRRTRRCSSMRLTTGACARVSRRFRRQHGSTFSIAKPASRSLRLKRGRCRRSRGRRPRRHSPTSTAIPSFRNP